MAYLIGVVLAAAVCGLATIVGFDRDRAFYPVVTMVIASFYGLFAVMGGSMHALMLESVGIAVFFLLAIAGFKRSLGIIVVALVAHGVFDFIHRGLISDPGVPPWWPQFCPSFDVVAAVWLAALLLPSSHRDQEEMHAHEHSGRQLNQEGWVAEHSGAHDLGEADVALCKTVMQQVKRLHDE